MSQLSQLFLFKMEEKNWDKTIAFLQLVKFLALVNLEKYFLVTILLTLVYK